MVVSIQFTPLYGVHTDQPAVSHLLTIDGFNILLDCGWTSAFDPTYLQNLAKVAPNVHVVLLTHPDIPHLGALPYAVANLGLNAPIFSTLPVWRMGQMFMYDAFLAHDAQAPFTVFNLDHVDAAFEISPPSADAAPRYRLLKYQQHFPLDELANGGKGIVITPHAAGHMLGGAVWNIKKNTESIVYAVDFNHRRERHLNPTTLSSFSRPSHLIIASARSQTRTETKKNTDIFVRVKNVVKKRGGNVLIPVDTAGRVIELAVQLHDAWATDREMNQVPLVILHDLSTRTFEFARSMIEWMSDEVVKRFDVSRENLFIFKHVKLCQSLKALEGLPSPMVVLASSISMEMGFARHLFAKWCQDSRNAVILADRPEPNTLYSKLYDHCVKNSDDAARDPKARDVSPLQLTLSLKRKEFLQGEELRKWREQERERIAREEEAARKKEEALRLEKEAAERERERQLSEAMKQEKVENQEAQTLAPSTKEQEKTKVSAKEILQDPKRYEEFTYTQLVRHGFIAGTQQVEVFEFAEPSRPLWDDYGQLVDTTRFMIGEDPGEGAPVQHLEHAGRGAKPEEEAEEVEENIPSKYVEEQLKVLLSCQLCHIDNSGLSDGDSLKRLVKEVEPRHVTLIAGSTADTAHLRRYLESNLLGVSGNQSRQGDESAEVPASVVAPQEMEMVDITSHSSVLEFHLQDDLVSELGWRHVGDAGIAFIDAVINKSESAKNVPTLGKPELYVHTVDELDVHDKMEIDSELSSLSVSTVKHDSESSFGHPTVYVGTVMLNRMKDVVIEAGMKAEFAGGALCVENPDTGVVVLLKKVGTQNIVLEGALSEEYLSIRDLLYEELVIPQ